jgi:hypothetical protein
MCFWYNNDFVFQICSALSCSFSEVKQYFVTTVAPFAVKYQNLHLEKKQLETIDVLKEFTADVVQFCKDSQQAEVNKYGGTTRSHSFTGTLYYIFYSFNFIQKELL